MTIIFFPHPPGNPRLDEQPIPAQVLPFPLSPGSEDHADRDQGEPSPSEIEAIEREMPLIRAEMDLVDAEIRVLTARPHPSELDWRRLRRAKARVARETITRSINRPPLTLAG